MDCSLRAWWFMRLTGMKMETGFNQQKVIVSGEGKTRKAEHSKTGKEVLIGSIEKMSKSKRNTVDPDDIMQTYGADTARWFMLSDSPPERDVEWTDAGAEGAHRFIQRVWRLVQTWSEDTRTAANPESTPGNGKSIDIRKATHKTLKAIGEDIERLAFNRAIARLYEFVNILSGIKKTEADATEINSAMKEGLDVLTQCLAPVMPHLAETCWEQMGHKDLVSEQAWPEYQESLATDDSILLPVQINGKKRADIEVSPDASTSEIEAATLQLDVVIRQLDGKTPRKVIVVPKRIVNVVI